MHAIILVFDEPEVLTKVINPPWFIEKFFDVICKLLPEKIANAICLNLPNFCYPRYEDVNCMHMRNGSIQKTKKLLSYLRGHRKLSKTDISFLRSSRFSSSKNVLTALGNLIKSHADDDILLFCAAHGGRISWFLGENKNSRKYIYYSDLQKLFNQFRGRLIVISEVCRALNLNTHLHKLKGRCLIIGTSLKNHLGSSTHSVVDDLSRYWQKRQVARVRVKKMHKIVDYKEWVDIPSGNSLVTRFPDDSSCPCFDKIIKTRVFRENNGPLLRIGAELDYLMYPPR